MFCGVWELLVYGVVWEEFDDLLLGLCGGEV